MELIIHDDTLPKIKSYHPLMYRVLDADNMGLRTGDVVRLGVEDFSKILRNFHVIKPLLEQYVSDKKYRANLWAVLNKPCDMVQDDSTGRKFDTNLFLCPLQSLMSELRPNGLFKKYVKTPISITPYKNILNNLFQEYLNALLESKFKISGKTPEAEKNKIIADKNELKKVILTTVDSQIFDYFKELEEPESIEGGLFQYASSEDNIHPFVRLFFLELSSNKKWNKYKEERALVMKGSENTEISREGLESINELFLNQQDSKGIFYFEPSIDLFNKEVNDFSYFIEIEDILTLKISEESIQNGQLVQLLSANRVVGLTRNFSDRLQNIMGNYFSKIGTADVKASGILALYSECFEKFSFGK